MRTMMNLVAWAGLPLAVRYLVRGLYMLLSDRLILAPGLSGLASAEGNTAALIQSKFLEAVDLYWIWQIALLVVAVRAGGGFSRGKAWTSVLTAQAVALAFQIGPAVLIARLSGLTVIRPFLF